jgi:hypothetical protein
MKSSKRLPNHILIWVIALVAIATLMIIASPKLRKPGEQQEKNQVVDVPKVISKIKHLEVISTTVKREGEPGAVVAIEILNNSEKPIIAIAIESGDEKDASGINKNGFRDGQPPLVVIEPYGTITMEMAISNLLPGKPLKIAGVIYADDSEAGEEAALGTMHRQRAHKKDKASTDNGGTPQ